MKRRTKLTVTLLLVLSLCIGLVPFAAFADDADPAPEQKQEAVASEPAAKEPEAEAPSPSDDKTEAAEPSADKDTKDEPEAKAGDRKEKSDDKEEVSSPAASFTAKTKDVKVQVDAPKGAFPKGTKMTAEAVSRKQALAVGESVAASGQEVVDAVAADINFCDKDGKPVQPKVKVDVKLTALRGLDGDVHYTASEKAERMGAADSDEGKFTASHFTIYGLIGSDYVDNNIDKHARYTYRFHEKDGNVLSEQIVRNGDYLTAPPSPGGDGKDQFAGWFEKKADGSWGDEILFDRAVVIGDDVTEDQTVNVYPKYEHRFKVILYTDDEMTNIYTTLTAADGSDVDVSAISLPGTNFTGWEMADGHGIGKHFPKGDSSEKVHIQGMDVHLIPTYSDHYIVLFDAKGNGEDDNEIAAVTVNPGETVDRPDAFADDQIVNGMRFKGWYHQYSYDESTHTATYTEPKYDFDQPVNSDLTLHAKWEAIHTHVTVKVWQENANDNDYTMVETYALNQMTVGDPIPKDEILAGYATDRYVGFHLNGKGAKPNNANYADDRPALVCEGGDTILSDGRSVVNIYYSRNTYQLLFRFEASISNANQTKLIGDYYTEAKNTIGYGDVFDTLTYVKYGQNMHQHIYNNPATKDKIVAFAEHPELNWSFWAEWLRDDWQTVFTEDNQNLSFNPGTKADGSSVTCRIKHSKPLYPFTRVSYYTDVPDGQDYEECEPVKRTVGGVEYTFKYRSSRTIYYEEYHTLQCPLGQETNGAQLIGADNYNSGYDAGQRRQEDPKEISNPNEWGKITWQYYYKGNKADGFEPINFYWIPTEHKLRFDPQNGETIEPETLSYGTPLASKEPDGYEAKDSVEDSTAWYDEDDDVTYYFAGWYEDSSCTGDRVDFSDLTMPARDVTYYAKWVLDHHEVIYHFENGQEPAGYSVAHGHKIDLDTQKPDDPVYTGHTFLGWKTEAGGYHDFSFDQPITQDTEIYAVWHSASSYLVEYRHGDHGKLSDALMEHLDPINNTDGRTHDYALYAKAAIRGICDSDEGYMFTGWKIAGEGTLYTEGTIDITKENDQADGSEDHIIVLIAQYEPVTERKTTVSYHSNFPDGTADQIVTIEGQAINGEFEIDKDNVDLGFIPSSGNWRFVRWSNQPDNYQAASAAHDLTVDHPTGLHEIDDPVQSDTALRLYFELGETVGTSEGTDNVLYAVWEKTDDPVDPKTDPEKKPAKKSSGKSSKTKRATTGTDTGDHHSRSVWLLLIILSATVVTVICRRRRLSRR